ncbi:hypothetical protein [Phenylobacterium sp.]|jgi:hypothetical protein|uniref:hypothetical protein n=1 Tax=Phenylobacterium sp. TaxID=1871053 RepID=UPI002F413F5D
MKALTIALLLAAAPFAAHAADDFTFVTTGKVVDGIRVPAEGAAFQGVQVTTYTAQVTYLNGKKETAEGKCGAWRNPPGAQFPTTGICVVPHVYEQQYSCQPEGTAASNCWGYLRGLPDGPWAGRTGLITYHSDAKGLSGVGRWN